MENNELLSLLRGWIMALCIGVMGAVLYVFPSLDVYTPPTYGDKT